MVHQIEDFFGCYLLYNMNPRFKGRTYIGFTVNPKRRIAQHNAGKHKGGAWRTSGRGPWEMALIVHGFPSDISALGFEWAWQHPESSRRLKHVPRKTKKETAFQYRVRVLSHMLCERPWCLLPLTVRWLQQEYCTDLIPSPPQHISYAYGLVDVVVAKKICGKKVSTDIDTDQMSQESPTSNSIANNIVDDITCVICNEPIKDSGSCFQCYEMPCAGCYHIVCLADTFLNHCPTEIIPVEGNCPTCDKLLLWGELVRKSKGFSQYIDEDDDNFEW